MGLASRVSPPASLTASPPPSRENPSFPIGSAKNLEFICKSANFGFVSSLHLLYPKNVSSAWCRRPACVSRVSPQEFEADEENEADYSQIQKSINPTIQS
jgi:hypothetical protein